MSAQQQWVNFTNDNEVTSIAVENNTLWVGTTGGLLKWNLTNSTYEKFIVSDGLVSNYVTSITIDSNNVKWIGTFGGISKFDGINWTNYNSSNSGLAFVGITDIEFDSSDIWVGTRNGLYKFDGIANWVYFDTANSGLSHNKITSILIDDNGDKWFGTFAGADKFDGVNWINYTSANSGLLNSPSCIEMDSTGNIWFGTSGVSIFDGSNWTNYTVFNSGLAGSTVIGIAFDDEGNVWFGTENGVNKFNGVAWQHFTETNSGLLSNGINDIISDSQGNVYFGQGSNQIQKYGGVSKFDGINWFNFETPVTLTANYIGEILIDSNGDKWFGNEYGVNKLTQTTWSHFNGFYGIQPNQGVIDLNGNIWWGNFLSIAKFDGTNWSYFDNSSSGLPYTQIQAMEVDGSNNIWISDGLFSGGVTKFDGTSWNTFDVSNSNLISNDIYSIKKDFDGSVWFGGFGGATNYDGANWTTIMNPNTFVGPVKSIGIEQNTMWFGTAHLGVFNFDGSNWVTYDTTNSILPSNDILKIEIDSLGNKWFGTNEGLCKYDGTSWTIFNTENSNLISNQIRTLKADDYGNLWIGSYGLSIFNENGVVLDIEKEMGNFSPKNFQLEQNFPNPFNPTTTISYLLEKNSNVNLSIYNIKGQLLKTLVNHTIPKGKHSVTWNGTDKLGKQVASGVYFYKLETPNFAQTKKMVLLK